MQRIMPLLREPQTMMFAQQRLGDVSSSAAAFAEHAGMALGAAHRDLHMGEFAYYCNSIDGGLLMQ